MTGRAKISSQGRLGNRKLLGDDAQSMRYVPSRLIDEKHGTSALKLNVSGAATVTVVRLEARDDRSRSWMRSQAM